MTKKSHAAKKTPSQHSKRRMTAQERNVATTTALPSLHDPDDATLGFGPRSMDPDRRTERLSYRDPEEASQGPLRFDETNYSVERLTLPEGGYNEYADECTTYRDEEGVSHTNYGPASGATWQDPQYANATQGDSLGDVPPAIDIDNEPDDPDLGFRLTAEDLEASPEANTYFDEDAEKFTGFGHHTPRSNRADELIREDAYHALDSRGDIDAPNISLHVRSGVVTIEGEVNDPMLRHRIEQCVDTVDGVKDINNRLHLAAPQPRRPWSEE